MQVVGLCRLTIEPHVFDAKLFIVRDPHTMNQPYKQSFPAHRPVMQYGPPNGVVVTPPPPLHVAPRNGATHQSPYEQARPRPTPPIQQQRASPATDPQNRILPPPYPSPNLQATHTPHSPQSRGSPGLHGQEHAGEYAESTSTSLEQSIQKSTVISSSTNGVAQRSISDGEPRPDPVIHMLAKKAQSDLQLTNLMKTVASGQATEEQLKVFQRHIDELSAILAKQREEMSKNSRTIALPPPAPQSAGPSPAPPTGTSAVQDPRPLRPGIMRPHHPTSGQPQIYYQSTPPLSQTEMTASPRGPDTKDVVIEFEKNGDRFLFPRFSILEYVPGCNVVIASFLIVRRGSTASTTNPDPNSKTHTPVRGSAGPKAEANPHAVSQFKRDSRSDARSTSTPNSTKADSKPDPNAEIDPPIYDPTLDYYQPVTVRFSSDDPKALSVLRQAVAPQEEVRRYMDDVMDKMTRAEYVYLAMRLPKSEEADVPEENGIGERGTPVAGESVGRAKKAFRIE